jgi:hypothetical protein
VSFDGVAEDPDKFLTDWDDDVMDTNMSAVIDTQDAVILGRRGYDEWARFWPESTIEQQVQELFLKDPWRDIYRGKG